MPAPAPQAPPTCCTTAAVHERLEDALDGCALVLGTSARLRSLSMPQMDVRKAAGRALEETTAGDVAILFGREAYGLTNEEIQRCHYLVHIDTNPEFGSLNLAQAVQVIAYELRMQALGGGPVDLPPQDWEPVDAGQMERFYAHLEETLLDIGFLNPEHPKKLLMRLRRLVQPRPAGPERDEYSAWHTRRGAARSGHRATP